MVLVPTAHAALITIDTTIPGTNLSSAGVGGVIANFYSFALMIAGVLAFGAIVWGGIKYATGRGNPAAETEGKSWITNALLGLLLLAGAWIILYTVNPQIVNLPQGFDLTPVAAVPPGGGGGYTCSGSTNGTCPSGSQCTAGAGGSFSCQGTACGGTVNGTCPLGRSCVLGTSGYSCSATPPTGGATVICKISNVPCTPPKICKLDSSGITPPGWETCENP